jgi:hypothetical protein
MLYEQCRTLKIVNELIKFAINEARRIYTVSVHQWLSCLNAHYLITCSLTKTSSTLIIVYSTQLISISRFSDFVYSYWLTTSRNFFERNQSQRLLVERLKRSDWWREILRQSSWWRRRWWDVLTRWLQNQDRCVEAEERFEKENSASVWSFDDHMMITWSFLHRSSTSFI